jgi:aminomethyltransferase
VDREFGGLKFFHLVFANIDSMPVIVSRTGYTGDLGYELWFSSQFAEPVWDKLMQAGKSFGMKPAGLLALDLARLEAGFILLDVDYLSVEKALIPAQRYTPFEIGLGWTVDLKKEHFLGCKKLRAESARGPSRRIVGLEIDLRDYEYLFYQYGLPPQLPVSAWRGGVPVYQDGRQVGHATTGGWSPILKKYIALATVSGERSELGSQLEMEVTVEHVRKTAGARIVKMPFFDPPRKKTLFTSEDAQ